MYAWAVNRVKLELAITKAGKKASEADVKAEYVKLAGKVVEVEEAPKKGKKK